MQIFEDENITNNQEEENKENNQEEQISQENSDNDATKKEKAPRIKIKFTGSLIAFFVCFVVLFILGLAIFSADFSYEKKVQRLKNSQYKLLYNEGIKKYGLSDDELEEFKKSFTFGELKKNDAESTNGKEYYDAELVYRPSIYKMREFKINDIFQVESLPKQKIEVVKGRGNYARFGIENKDKDFLFELNDIYSKISSFYSNGKKQIKNDKEDYYLQTESIDGKRINRYKLFIDTDNLTFVKRKVNGVDKVIGVMPKGSFSSSDLEDGAKLIKAIQERINKTEKIDGYDYIYYPYNNSNYPALKFASLTINRARSTYGTNDFLINTLTEINISREYYEKRDVNAQLIFYEEIPTGEREELVRFQVPKNETIINNISFCDKSVRDDDVIRWFDQLSESLEFLNTQEGENYIFSNWYIDGKDKMEEFKRITSIRIKEDTNICSNFIKKTYQVKYFKSIEAFEKYKQDPTNSEYAPHIENIDSTNFDSNFLNYNKKQEFENGVFLNKYYRVKNWSQVKNDNTSYDINKDAFENSGTFPRKINKDIILVPNLVAGVVYKFYAMGEELNDLEFVKYPGEFFNNQLDVKNLFFVKYNYKYGVYDLKHFVDSETGRVLENGQVENNSSTYVVKKCLARWNNRPYNITFKFSLNGEDKEYKVSGLNAKTNDDTLKLSAPAITSIINSNKDSNPILNGFYFDDTNGVDISFDDDNVKNFDVNLKIKEYKFALSYAKRDKLGFSLKTEIITVKFGAILDKTLQESIRDKVNGVLSYEYVGFGKTFKNIDIKGKSYANGEELVDFDDLKYEFFKKYVPFNPLNPVVNKLYARYEILSSYKVHLKSDENNVDLTFNVERDSKLTLDLVVEKLKKRGLYKLSETDKQLYAIYTDSGLTNLIDFQHFEVLDDNTEIYLKYLKPVEYKFYHDKNKPDTLYLTKKFYLSKYFDYKLDFITSSESNKNNEVSHVDFLNSEALGSDLRVENKQNFKLDDEKLEDKSISAQIYWKFFQSTLRIKQGTDVVDYSLKLQTSDYHNLPEKDLSIDDVEKKLLEIGLKEIFKNNDYIDYAYGISKIDDGSKNEIKLLSYKNETHEIEFSKIVYEFNFKNEKSGGPICQKEYSEGDALLNDNTFEYIADFLGKGIRGYKSPSEFGKYAVSKDGANYNQTVEQVFEGFDLSKDASSFEFSKFRNDTFAKKYIQETSTRNRFKVNIIRLQEKKETINVNIYRALHNILSVTNPTFSSFANFKIDEKNKEIKYYDTNLNKLETIDFKTIFPEFYSGYSDNSITINGVRYKLRGIAIKNNSNNLVMYKTLEDLLNNSGLDWSNLTNLEKVGNNFEETLELYFLFYKELEISYEYAGNKTSFRKFPGEKIDKDKDFEYFSQKLNDEILNDGSILKNQTNKIVDFLFTIGGINKSTENGSFKIPDDTFIYEATLNLITEKRLVKFNAEYEAVNPNNDGVVRKTTKKDIYYLLKKEEINLNSDLNYLNIGNFTRLNLLTTKIEKSNNDSISLSYKLKTYKIVFKKDDSKYKYNTTRLEYNIPIGLKPNSYISSIPEAIYNDNTDVVTTAYTIFGGSSEKFKFYSPIDSTNDITLTPKFEHEYTVTIKNEADGEVIERALVPVGDDYKTRDSNDELYKKFGKIIKYLHGSSEHEPGDTIDDIDGDIEIKAVFEKPKKLNITVDGKKVSEHPYISDNLRTFLYSLMDRNHYDDDMINFPKEILKEFSQGFEFKDFNIVKNLEDVDSGTGGLNFKLKKPTTGNDYDAKLNLNTKYNLRSQINYDDGEKITHARYSQHKLLNNSDHKNMARDEIIKPSYNYQGNVYNFSYFIYNNKKYHNITDIENMPDMDKVKINLLEVYYTINGTGNLVIDYYMIKVNKNEGSANFSDYEYLESQSYRDLKAGDHVETKNYLLSNATNYSENPKYDVNISPLLYNNGTYSDGHIKKGQTLRLAVFYSKRKESTLTFHYKYYNGVGDNDTTYQVTVKNQKEFDLYSAFNLAPTPGYELWSIKDIRTGNYNGVEVDKLNGIDLTSNSAYYVNFIKKQRITFKDIDGKNLNINGKNYLDVVENNQGDLTIGDIETNNNYKYDDNVKYHIFSHWSKRISSLDEDRVKNDTIIDGNLSLYAIFEVRYKIDMTIHTEENQLFKDFDNHSNNEDYKEFTKKENFKKIYNTTLKNKTSLDLTIADILKNNELISNEGFTSQKYGKKMYYVRGQKMYKYNSVKYAGTDYHKVYETAINKDISITEFDIKNKNNEYINSSGLIPLVAFVHKIIAKMTFNGLYINVNNQHIISEAHKEFVINSANNTLNQLLKDTTIENSDFLPRINQSKVCRENVSIKSGDGVHKTINRSTDIIIFENIMYDLTFFKR